MPTDINLTQEVKLFSGKRADWPKYKKYFKRTLAQLGFRTLIARPIDDAPNLPQGQRDRNSKLYDRILQLLQTDQGIILTDPENGLELYHKVIKKLDGNVTSNFLNRKSKLDKAEQLKSENVMQYFNRFKKLYKEVLDAKTDEVKVALSSVYDVSYKFAKSIHPKHAHIADKVMEIIEQPNPTIDKVESKLEDMPSANIKVKKEPLDVQDKGATIGDGTPSKRDVRQYR